MTIKELMSKGIIHEEWMAYFMAKAKLLLVWLGVPEDKQRFIEKLDYERAHYSAQGFDQEVYLDRWDGPRFLVTTTEQTLTLPAT
jgi:glycyl-tRNA synthetase